MKRNSKRLILFGSLTLLMMLVIFLFSAQEGTDSGSLSKWLAESAFGRALLRILPRLSDQGVEHDLRKYAHMAEYTMLAIPAFGFFCELLLRRKVWPAFLTALLFCFLYACSDEFHQLFVPGRAGLFSDVLIDMVGVLFGLMFASLVHALRKEPR
ncbi:MAG: VanZ family protein [Oscillospiraceae bacterium]|nr:VanZ family protein [Oscillospiraceae bacterium]